MKSTPAHHHMVERVSDLPDDDMQSLCEAADAAIIDGGGFGWVNPPGRRALERYLDHMEAIIRATRHG